jgi:TPR repeat protein
MCCGLIALSFAGSAWAQTSPKQMVHICLPRNLVERESWENPLPGSRMLLFRNLVRDYLLEHGDVRSQYRIKEEAFAHFDPGRTTPRGILQEVSANQECPPSNYTAELDISPLDGAAEHGSAQPGPSQAARNPLERGWQYQVGQGVPKDPVTAARLYEDAARQGLPDAMYRLGLMYLDGEGVQQNFGNAVYWFYQAAQRGHPGAQAEVGYALFEGQGAQQNERAAFEWLLLAARAGLSRAQCAVAILYEGGAGIGQSDSEAVVWFRKAAEQGELYAMHRLGVHLREGKGVPWNEAEAMQWFRKAADRGFALSQSSLGWGYMKGLGQGVGQGVQDYRQAAYWFDLAAQQGEPHAQVNLGLFYENAWGVERNLARAKALYEAAADGPDPKVASYARRFAEGLADTPLAATVSRPRSSSNGDTIGGWVVAGAAFVAGATLLKMLFSSDSSSADAAPPNDSSYSGGTGSDTSWSAGSSYTPPTPTCRVVQTSTAFEVPQGTALSNPTGPTTVVCD